MNKRHLHILVLALTAIGLSFFFYKWLILDFPLIAHKQTILWTVEAKVTFHAQDKPAKITLFLPNSNHNFVVADENFISQGFGLILFKEEGNRHAVWSKRKRSGRQTLYYRALIRQDETSPTTMKVPPKAMPSTLTGPSLEAARTVFAQVRENSVDTETLIGELMRQLNRKQPERNIVFLLGNKSSEIKKLEVAEQILTLGEIPARIVQGIRVGEQRKSANIMHWLEVFDQKQWQSFNPENGRIGLPSDYLAWWLGSQPLIQTSGVKNVRVNLSVSPTQVETITSALAQTKDKTPRLLEFSLFSLPLETQAVYRILLMIPLGALLLVILRNIVGIKTFGTFMPILIALAFRETQLLWGIILFSLVVAIGLGIRFYLEHLKLLLVPRLAAVLIIVVIIMAILSIFSHKLGLERGMSVALFPMVILTMTIERMCVVWEERGATESIQQGLGSLLVAALTYLTMSIPFLEHLLFVFPELLLLLLAGTLLLGRYSGFRLLELPRFKALAKDHS